MDPARTYTPAGPSGWGHELGTRTGASRMRALPQSGDTRSMTHALPPLPYPYGALEPTIDELTMRIHHDKHHGAYVAGLNAALEGTALADRPVQDVLADLDALPEDKRTAVRNHGGGQLNHSL